MSQKSILMSLAAVLFMALMVVGVVFWAKQRTSQEEPKEKKQVKTMEEVLKDLTAPESTVSTGTEKSSQTSQGVIENLTAPSFQESAAGTEKTKEPVVPKEVIDSLTAPR